ncbi:cardiolipin synthase [Piscinibacter sp.]|uniref:cardiolipin synthase n=1 Tax=Piscinibacter sp. TaxID=1903157 RepID=UPI002BE60748|nr:cardiolipin synthase [Albitalea sp.]HUG23344.1 cardiolipin synthase [Albitalea sp.]
MALPAATKVQVEGSRGPLSTARSKAVLAALEARALDTNIFDRHLAVEEALAGSPLVAGNKVVLLQDGPSTYEAMFAAIRDAKDHINLETYIVEDDEIGQRFAAALIAKQRQGVAVHLVYDAVGALGTPREFFTALEDAGIKVLQFNPVNPLLAKAGWNVNQRDHRKLLIVDGRSAFVGGINISAVYSGGSIKSASRTDKRLPWRDTHLHIEGPVVAEFQKLFMDTWAKQKGEALPPRNFFPLPAPSGKEVVRAIGGAPDEPFSAIYATFISAINSAETEVLLTNAYFAPDPQLRTALKDAVRRGVDVRLILPSATDSALIFHVGRSYYDELLRAGVKIYERREVLLHSKTALIDGVWSTIGSTNLDWRSFLHNQEVNAVVLGAAFGAQMRAAFERDLAGSVPILLAQWEQRSLTLRLKEGFARFWEYWL